MTGPEAYSFDEEFYQLCKQGKRGEEAFRELKKKSEAPPATDNYQHYLRARNYRAKKNKKSRAEK